MRRLLSASDTAERLRMRKDVVLKMLEDGEIPASRMGKMWRVDEEQLHEWFKARAAKEADARRKNNGKEN